MHNNLPHETCYNVVSLVVVVVATKIKDQMKKTWNLGKLL